MNRRAARAATRSAPSLALLFGEPLPVKGIRELALRRARNVLDAGLHAEASLLELLATAWLLGVEDARDALDREKT